MTTEAILRALTTADLPDRVVVAPGCTIVDVPLYIETNIHRLESDSALLRNLALEAMQCLAEKLT